MSVMQMNGVAAQAGEAFGMVSASRHGRGGVQAHRHVAHVLVVR